jgi:hypothetical protein
MVIGLLSETNGREKFPMADLQKIVDGLSKLTVSEAADLAKRLEEKWKKGTPTLTISDEELKSARADLEAGCSPGDFFKKVGMLAKRATPMEWFNEPRWHFLRDAMIIAEFAKQLEGTHSVHLANEADAFPDGFVETSEGTLNVEVTEVDKEGRRRGDEYKLGTARPESVDDWEERLKSIPAELERVILKKVNKKYNPKPTLVVYLNLGFGVPEEKIFPVIEDAKRKHAALFEGIRVLWEGRLI